MLPIGWFLLEHRLKIKSSSLWVSTGLCCVYITSLKVYHYDILLIHKPCDMSLLLFHQGNIPIIEDDMKFAKLPLPTNSRGGWTTNVLSTVELITIYNQVKNEQIDGIMIVDSLNYDGLYEQRAISTGFVFNNSRVEFHFSHSYSVGGDLPTREGFINDDHTMAIVSVTISSTGILTYRYHNLE